MIDNISLFGCRIGIGERHLVANDAKRQQWIKDIGGFVGTYLYEDVDDIKNNIQIMKNIFGHEENLEIGEMILLQNWNNWNNDE